MARSLTLIVLCLCLTVAFAADLRRLIADRAAGIAPASAPRAGADGKTGDLDTAHSWGWGGPGWGGWGWGGYGGWGPWGYGYGGFGGPWGGYGGWW